MEENFYVYGHLDPELNVPFYIGKGKKKRIYSKTRDDLWLSYVKNQCPDYKAITLTKPISEEDAYRIESIFINKFGQLHYMTGTLFNWMPGDNVFGVGIRIGGESDAEYIKDLLSEEGIMLWESLFDEIPIKIKAFFNSYLMELWRQNRHKYEQIVTKRTNPRKEWIIPFCIKDVIKKQENYSIRISPSNTILHKINKAVDPFNLPSDTDDDNTAFIHRVMSHFIHIIRESVCLIRPDGKQISVNDYQDWPFYADDRDGYIKAIQSVNAGLKINAKYKNMNTNNHRRKDIYNFSVQTY